MGEKRRQTVARWGAMALVAALGLGTTLQLRNQSESRADDAEQAAFDTAADRVERRLARELGRFEDLLLATSGTVAAGTDASAFHAFVERVELTERYPGAVGVAYVERRAGPPEEGLIRFVEPAPSFELVGANILLLPEARAALADGNGNRVRLTARLKNLEPVLDVAAEDGALFAIFAPLGDQGDPAGWVGLALQAEAFSLWLAEGDLELVEVDIYDGIEATAASRLTPSRDDHDAIRTSYRRQAVFGRDWTIEVRQVGTAGSADAAGAITLIGLAATALALLAMWATSTAVFRQRRMVERLAHRATHDELTGLANRRLLRTHLSDGMEARRQIAVLYCDLDRFKVANDSLGHTAGDHLLVEVAERFKACVREGDLVARLGGDEFAVACDVLHESDATQLAERLRLALIDPFVIQGHEVFLSVSIGVALAANGADVEQLIADADSAMYRSKDEGRGRVSAASSGQRAAAHERLQLEAALHRAPERDELRLHYQPIVDLNTGATVGREALVRWAHPTLGLLAPDRFIPLAEDSGLITGLGAWVLERACRDWAAGHRLPVSVNLSPRQIDGELAGFIRTQLEENGMPADQLTVEVTESVVATPTAAEQLFAVRALGVKVAVDDFGTGYSSLAALRHLPVDVIKIDRRFVAGIADDPVDHAIVEAIIRLVRTLDLELVAEGVETESQAFALRSSGCPLAQGYLFGRPAPLPTKLRETVEA